MKRLAPIIIITFVVAGTGMIHSVAQAQEQTELQLQYRLLQLQMIQLLQAQIAQGGSLPSSGVTESSNVAIPEGELCTVRYEGSSGIANIQQELLNQGYAIEKIDGKIGPNTRAAVSAFQTAANIKVDGLIGAQTRAALSRASVACVGDAGVSLVPAMTTPPETPESTEPETTVVPNLAVCHLRYTGTNDVATVQQSLLNQGYSIEKVDGKIGPNTRAAVSAFQTAEGITVDGSISEETRKKLARRSITCDSTPATTVLPESGETPIAPVTPSETEPSSSPSTPPPITTPTPLPETAPETAALVEKTKITASVRSTVQGVPDDTAVFTYELKFNTNDVVYVSTNANSAFEIKVLKMGGLESGADSVNSIISSGQKLVREDGSSYFRIKDGDTLSLRSSVQPGEGQYYAELGRLSYTTDDAFTVQNPTTVNYGFDASNWRSTVVTVLN